MLWFCIPFGIVSLLFKIAIWWWAVVLRLSEEGSVASGKMITECMEANPKLQTCPDGCANPMTPDADGKYPTWNTDTILALMNGASCNDPSAFQTKGGKLFLAWIIITAIKCV